VAKWVADISSDSIIHEIIHVKVHLALHYTLSPVAHQILFYNSDIMAPPESAIPRVGRPVRVPVLHRQRRA